MLWKDRNCWNPWKFLLKGSHTDLLRLIYYELQCRASDWNALEIYGEELDCPSSGQELGSSILPDRNAGRGHCSFSDPFPHRAKELTGELHIRDYTNLAYTVCLTLVILWGPAPPNLQANPSCFLWLFHTNGLSWPMLQIFLNSLKQAAPGFSKTHTSH